VPSEVSIRLAVGGCGERDPCGAGSGTDPAASACTAPVTGGPQLRSIGR
jgi:hypothetical protein